MRKLAMRCTVAALVAIAARKEVKSADTVALAARVVPAITQEIASELGLASWYGEQFQGSPTASGETFDMNGFTAAHRSLPLGTKIRVTNLKNHRTLVVRVNDRGPFVHNRFLDVSMAAAKKLGFLGTGLALVRAEVISFPKSYVRN